MDEEYELPETATEYDDYQDKLPDTVIEYRKMLKEE
jgi:hypothetical protein